MNEYSVSLSTTELGSSQWTVVVGAFETVME